MPTISKNEIEEIKNAKIAAYLKGNVNPEDMATLEVAIATNTTITSLFLEDINVVTTKCMISALKKTSSIRMLAISKIPNASLENLMSQLRDLKIIKGLMFSQAIDKSQASIIQQNLKESKNIISLALTADNAEIILTNLTTPYLEKLSIDDLNDKTLPLLMTYIKLYSHVKILTILRTADEASIKRLCLELPSLKITASSPQISELINKNNEIIDSKKATEKKEPEARIASQENVSVPESSAQDSKSNNKKEQEIQPKKMPVKKVLEAPKPEIKDLGYQDKLQNAVEKPKADKMEEQNPYKNLLNVVFAENKDQEQFNNYLTVRSEFYTNVMNNLEKFGSNKRATNDPVTQNKKMKTETNTSQDLNEILQKVPSVSRMNIEQFNKMMEMITSENIERVLKLKFPKNNNANILCLVANYQTDYFNEFYAKCKSLYPRVEELLYDTFPPNYFNIFHAICKKFSENNLKEFMKQLHEDTLKKLLLSPSKLSQINLAPIHIIALYQPFELIVGVFEKKPINSDSTTSITYDAILSKCVKENTRLQAFHLNYLYEKFPFLKNTTIDCKIELPTDDFLALTNPNLSIEAILDENEKIKKDNAILQDRIQGTWTTITDQLTNLPLFFASYLPQQKENNLKPSIITSASQHVAVLGRLTPSAQEMFLLGKDLLATQEGNSNTFGSK